MIILYEPFNSLWKNQDPFQVVPTLSGKVYRAIANRKTLCFSVENQDYFIKIHTGVGWREIIKNILSAKTPILSAKNEWQAINKLNQLNIDCPKALAFGIQGKSPAKLNSFIITKALENTISLEDFCSAWPTQKPPFSQKTALIKKIASISKTLHNHGIIHQDYYLCHFLLDLDSLQHLPNKLYLIDLHRMLLLKKPRKRLLIKDIGGLYFSALDIGLTMRDYLRFIKSYSNQSLRHELTMNLHFWKQVSYRAIKLYVKAHQKKPDIVV